jgi:hypothetical protein
MLALSPLSQNILNIEDKKRRNLLAWRGQFSPQLVESILTAYAPSEAFVLDPFMGSGTVLYEAGRIGLQAFGVEINPAAVKLSQIYKQINRSKTRRETVLNRLEMLLEEHFPYPQNGCLFNNAESTHEEEIIDRFKKLHSIIGGGDIKEILETLIVLIDFYKPDLSTIRIWSIWRKLRKVVICLPYSKNPINVELCDARNLPLPDNCVDLVITSPPYINVFNYHQQYRASIEAIGWNVLELAKSEIGSNRKFRKNRFLTIVQYCIDMADVLKELGRVVKQYSQLIFIVGKESMVKKTRFFNGDILSEIAKRCLGYEIAMKQQRFFKNKFGQIIYEDILHLATGSKRQTSLKENPAAIARQVLEKARLRAPSESREDLELALQEFDTVPPSPLYRVERLNQKCAS